DRVRHLLADRFGYPSGHRRRHLLVRRHRHLPRVGVRHLFGVGLADIRRAGDLLADSPVTAHLTGAALVAVAGHAQPRQQVALLHALAGARVELGMLAARQANVDAAADRVGLVDHLRHAAGDGSHRGARFARPLGHAADALFLHRLAFGAADVPHDLLGDWFLDVVAAFAVMLLAHRLANGLAALPVTLLANGFADHMATLLAVLLIDRLGAVLDAILVASLVDLLANGVVARFVERF